MLLMLHILSYSYAYYKQKSYKNNLVCIMYLLLRQCLVNLSTIYAFFFINVHITKKYIQIILKMHMQSMIVYNFILL